MLKNYSSMFRYNGIVVQTLTDYLRSELVLTKGYSPSEGTMVREPEVNDNPSLSANDIGLIKLHCLQALSTHIPLIDNVCFDGRNHEKDLFVDGVHLSDAGAKEYTKMVVSEIRGYVTDNN